MKIWEASLLSHLSHSFYLSPNWLYLSNLSLSSLNFFYLSLYLLFYLCRFKSGPRCDLTYTMAKGPGYGYKAYPWMWSIATDQGSPKRWGLSSLLVLQVATHIIFSTIFGYLNIIIEIYKLYSIGNRVSSHHKSLSCPNKYLQL